MRDATRHKALRSNFDSLLLALILAGFILIAARALASVPRPDTDESMTLQVTYEMINNGRLAFPMYRYLGGNIENVWHSYTPVFFALLGGFQSVFGWGLVEGRAFNLVAAALILVMVHLIGRRLFDWRTGLIAVVVLVSDPTFLDRSRIVRNDYVAALFGLLAYYLYETAEERNSRRLYVASGVAAGAGVMCHTNLLYVFAAIGALMLLRDGWRTIKAGKVYLFAAGALAVMAYEIVYDLLDYQNFLLQNRADPMHFQVLSGLGWWANLKQESVRYLDWHNGFLKVDAPLTLLHLFHYLAIAAGIYLALRLTFSVKQGRAGSDPRARVLLATVVVMLFFALITQRKIIQYVIHLSPWFALSTGILIRDGLSLIGRLRRLHFRWKPLAHGAVVACMALAVLAFSYQLVRQNRHYLRNVADPDAASFVEIKDALRAVVPDDVCPVAVKSGFLWLAFPEKDYCFVALEGRMKEAVDIVGKEYALLVRPKHARKEAKLVKDLIDNARLIGELNGTAYGTFQVYYTGTDPRYLALPAKRYYFFGGRRGRVSDEQIKAAREVWRAGADELKICAGLPDSSLGPDGLVIQANATGDNSVASCPAEIKPQTIYQVSIDASLDAGRWQLIVTDCETGAPIYSRKIDGRGAEHHFDGLFRTSRTNLIKVSLRPVGDGSSSLTISGVFIREIGPV